MTDSDQSRAGNADKLPSAEHYEKLYKMLLTSIPSSVLLLDRGLRVISANRNFLQKARLVEPEVIGRRLEEVFPSVIYDHMNLGSRIMEVFRTGEALDGEQMVYRAPGLPTCHYYYSVIPFVWGDKVEITMLLMNDVTEQIRLGKEAKNAERHLAGIVESASDLVISTDVRGRVQTWNTAAEGSMGFTQEEARNRHLWDFCEGTHREALAGILCAGPSHSSTEPVEVEMVSRKGGSIPISWVFSPMRNGDGQVVGLVAMGRDLTERRKLEAQHVVSLLTHPCPPGSWETQSTRRIQMRHFLSSLPNAHFRRNWLSATETTYRNPLRNAEALRRQPVALVQVITGHY